MAKKLVFAVKGLKALEAAAEKKVADAAKKKVKAAPKVQAPTNPVTLIDQEYGSDIARRVASYVDSDAPTLAVKPDVVEPLAVRPQIAIRTKPSGIIAYHGSPHTFDRFDMSKIGTGQGNQKYGHGLYFAENEGVAKGYRDELSGLLSKSDTGSMYQVRIDADPETFFNYDSIDRNKSFNEQPNEIKKLLEPFIETSFNDNIERIMREKSRITEVLNLQNPNINPYFLEKGIPGIKYLDGFSREAGSGSRNFVVFDDELVNILKRYREGGLAVKKKKKPRVSKRKALSQSSPNSSM